MSFAPSHFSYRRDIDGLRAIAILSVVAFHAFPETLQGGFIGVDIFFVISGFLISSILLKDIEQNRFNIFNFYSRRIARIFPALIFVLSAALILGWIYLLSDDYRLLGKHVLGGALFSSNFFLWAESGYFDVSGDNKPLLHLWSLGIEEQFYLIFPLFFTVGLVRRCPWIFILSICVASFLCNVFLLKANVVADFYSPLSRVWELMLGALLAWHKTITAPKSLKRESDLFQHAYSAIGALLILIGLLNISKELYYPGWYALIPTTAALLIIHAGENSLLNREILSSRLLVFIGHISYPLYLWHWVLLSFAHLIEGPDLGAFWICCLLGVSFLLSWGTVVAIERPIRKRATNIKVVFGLVLSIVALGALGLVVFLMRGFDGRQNQVEYKNISGQFGVWNFKKNDLCNHLYGDDHLSFCVANSEHPEIILLGDSHANQLYPGLIHAYKNKKGILSIGNGPPLTGVSVKFQKVTDHPWQQGAYSFKRVMDIVRDSPDITTVILASNWEPVIHGGFVLEEHQRKNGTIHLIQGEIESNPENTLVMFQQSFEATIRALLAMHKKVVVMIDTPEVMINPRKCFQNLHSETLCTFPKAKVFERQEIFRSYIANLALKYPIKVFDPVDIVCPKSTCFEYVGDQLIFRDLSHISELTSEKIGERLMPFIESNP